MLLTTEQESILNGEQGKTRQKAIRLLIDLGKAAFIVDDIVHSSDPSFSQGGLKSDKLKKTWLRESCTAVNEEDFISGLLV